MATKDPTVERQASELWKTITHTKSAASRIDPSDDSWMMRLLRSRLEQDIHETPPEWATWIRGADLDWAEFHLLENVEHIFEKVETDDEFHFVKTPAVPAATSWRPKNTGKKKYERRKPTWDHSGKPFKGMLKDAPETWEYRHPEEAVANEHGLTNWIFRQGRSGPDAKHSEEIAERAKLRLMKSGTSYVWTAARAWSAIEKLMRIAKSGKPPAVVPQELLDTVIDDEADDSSTWKQPHDDDQFNGQNPPKYTEGTNHVIYRGSRKPDTEETRVAAAEEWEVTRKKVEALILTDKAWSPLDPPEDTRVLPNGAKVNRSNPTFKRIMVEIDKHHRNYDTLEGLHEELGLKYETERKRELEDLNMAKKCPTTHFTKAQIEDLRANDGRLAFVHVVMDKPRWYRLDMDRHATYKDAINEVFSKSFEEACRVAKIPIYKRDTTDPRSNEEAPEAAFEFKKIAVRYSKYFHPDNIYILDLRNLSPLAAAFAEEEDAA
jgi:hypothetical protein